MRPFHLFLIAAVFLAESGLTQNSGLSIEAPAGSRVLLQARGDGVQIYACSRVENGFKWTFKGPDAKLLDSAGNEIGAHFVGPTWKLADGSQVQGELLASQPSPDAGSVPWLLLRAKAGTATGALAGVAFIRRTETHGGVAPAAGCQNSEELDKTVRAAYTATYTFYAAPTQ
jgi:hypothetical protein